MAIYHFSASIISRGKGQSAIASASYRSGERLEDERTGEVKFYKRDVEPEAMILTPEHAPEWTKNRERLWNEVEKIEKNHNSQLAREINIALPVELSKDKQRELIQEYVQEQFVNKGMVADVAIHRDDVNNPHAHVMLTVRPFDENGEWGNKKRKEYKLDKNGEKILKPNGTPDYKTVSLTDWDKKQTLENWRDQWSNYVNRSLEREGVKERISHLSNEARGLDTLPTKHEGYKVRAMEDRGVQTEIGDYNRTVKEYNQAVVDLQSYREEKQALEKEMARKQEERQTVERFNTPTERHHLQETSKLLNTDKLTIPTIQARQQQLNKLEDRLNNNSQYLRWKDQSFKEAKDHYKWIHSYEQRIQESQQKIENINWLNPLKIKENRTFKQELDNRISRFKDDIKYHDEKLNYYRDKLDFKDETAFKHKEHTYQEERPGLLEKNQNQRKRLSYERDTLQKAEKALENRVVRQVASKYPEHPEMAYMSFKTAKNIIDLSKQNGNQFIPIEKVKQVIDQGNQSIKTLEKNIQRIHHYRSRLERAEGYLNQYEKHQETVDKYENNVFWKGKMTVSKSAKQEYQDAVDQRDHYKNLMEKDGVTSRADFEQQVDKLSQVEPRVPEFTEKIESYTEGLSLFRAVMQGIEQASRQMEMSQKMRQPQQQRRRGKIRNNSLEWEIGD